MPVIWKRAAIAFGYLAAFAIGAVAFDMEAFRNGYGTGYRIASDYWQNELRLCNQKLDNRFKHE